jgi:hypothetical protein
MALAVKAADVRALGWAVLTMVILILLVDALIWRRWLRGRRSSRSRGLYAELFGFEDDANELFLEPAE